MAYPQQFDRFPLVAYAPASESLGLDNRVSRESPIIRNYSANALGDFHLAKSGGKPDIISVSQLTYQLKGSI